MVKTTGLIAYIGSGPEPRKEVDQLLLYGVGKVGFYRSVDGNDKVRCSGIDLS